MLYEVLNILVIALAVAASGCSSTGGTEHQPLAGTTQVDVGSLPATRKADAAPQPEGPFTEQATITLRDAIAQALVNSPGLRAYSLEVRAAEARKVQAGLLPNPEIEVETEEFGGTGERRRFDSSQTTIQLGQLIELADKRAKRTDLATVERDLAEWDYRSKRLDVMNQVAQAFIEVMAAQEQLALSKDSAELAKQAHLAVVQRVKAGKVSPVDEAKANIALSTSRIELQKAEQALVSARYNLAAACGAQSPVFERVTGPYYEILPAPSLEELSRQVSRNPDVARWVTERYRRLAALDLEKAKATPDIGIRGGIQRFDQGDDTAFILGLSIPIPLFNRNQGNIREAIYRLAKTQQEHKAAEIQVRAAVADAVPRLSSSSSEITALREEVLPAAQSTFDAARKGYEQGKFGYLDVLDAQRTLFEVREKYIEALATHHKARADVERLIGRSLESLNGRTEAKNQLGANYHGE